MNLNFTYMQSKGPNTKVSTEMKNLESNRKHFTEFYYIKKSLYFIFRSFV